jgi:hypothetical protein
MFIAIKQLSQKIDYLLCLYEGSYQKLVEVINDKIRLELFLEAQTTQRDFITKRTLQNWHNGKITKIDPVYADKIPELFGLDPDIFKYAEAWRFFNHLTEITMNQVSLINIFSSLPRDSRKEDRLHRLCGLYYFYYPMLDKSGTISTGMLYIFHYRSAYKVVGYLKFKELESKWIGIVTLSHDKLYIILEETKNKDGITMILANMPEHANQPCPEKCYSSCQGVLISTAYMRNTMDPSAAYVYIEPVMLGANITETDISKYREAVGQDTLEDIKNRDEDIAKLITNELPGFVLQAKAEDTENLFSFAPCSPS